MTFTSRTGNTIEISATNKEPATKPVKPVRNRNIGNKQRSWQQNQNSGNESLACGNKTSKTGNKIQISATNKGAGNKTRIPATKVSVAATKPVKPTTKSKYDQKHFTKSE
ncbi:hypothetical protein [Bacillus sp. V59.32b]|uniref:hypothetical protein n=1 Tax=Bacillus sp. V59.32b TaxID=1758642 RepID=UPI000E3C61A9|nr:hypothetical protein [Bacillus sp. V59.32b]RFU67970.1 hypothetical protein D0463_06300 [Bacillus sp. V59.32b]